MAGNGTDVDFRTGVAYCKISRFAGAPAEKGNVRFAMCPVVLVEPRMVSRKAGAMVIAEALVE